MRGISGGNSPRDGTNPFTAGGIGGGVPVKGSPKPTHAGGEGRPNHFATLPEASGEGGSASFVPEERQVHTANPLHSKGAPLGTDTPLDRPFNMDSEKSSGVLPTSEHNALQFGSPVLVPNGGKAPFGSNSARERKNMTSTLQTSLLHPSPGGAAGQWGGEKKAPIPPLPPPPTSGGLGDNKYGEGNHFSGKKRGGTNADPRSISPNPLAGGRGDLQHTESVPFTSDHLQGTHHHGGGAGVGPEENGSSVDSDFKDLSSDEDADMVATLRSRMDNAKNSASLDGPLGGSGGLGATTTRARKRKSMIDGGGGQEDSAGASRRDSAMGRGLGGGKKGMAPPLGGDGQAQGLWKGKNPFSGKANSGGLESTSLSDTRGTGGFPLAMPKGAKGGADGLGSVSMTGRGDRSSGVSSLFHSKHSTGMKGFTFGQDGRGGEASEGRETPEDLSPEARHEYERLRALSLFVPTSGGYHNGEGLDRPGVLHAEEGWHNRHYTKLLHEGYKILIDWKVLFMLILLICIGVAVAGLGESASELISNKKLLRVEELSMNAALAMIDSIRTCGTSSYKTPGAAVEEPSVVGELRNLVKKVDWQTTTMNKLLDTAKTALSQQDCFTAADQYNQLFAMGYSRRAGLDEPGAAEVTSYARAWALGWTQWRAEGLLASTEDLPITSKRAITSVSYNLMCLNPFQTINLASAFNKEYECSSNYENVLSSASVSSINYEMALHTMFDFISDLDLLNDIPDVTVKDLFHVISFSVVIVLCLLAMVYLFRVPLSYRNAEKEKNIVNKDFITHSSLVEMRRSTLRLLDYYIWRLGAFEPIHLKEAWCMGYELKEEEWNHRLAEGKLGFGAGAAVRDTRSGKDGRNAKMKDTAPPSMVLGRTQGEEMMEMVVVEGDGKERMIEEMERKKKVRDDRAEPNQRGFLKPQASSSLSDPSDLEDGSTEQLLGHGMDRGLGEEKKGGNTPEAEELAFQDSFAIWKELAESDDLHSYKGKSLPKQAMERAKRLALLVDSSTTDRLQGSTQIQILLHKVAAILLLLRPFIPRHLLRPVSHDEWSSMRNLGPSIPFRRSHITLQEGLRTDVSVYLFVSFYPFHRAEAVESARKFHVTKRSMEKQRFLQEERKRQEEKCFLFRESNLEKLYQEKRRRQNLLLTDMAEKEASARQAERRLRESEKERNAHGGGEGGTSGRSENGKDGGGRQDLGLAGMMAGVGDGGDGEEEGIEGEDYENTGAAGNARGGATNADSQARVVTVLSPNELAMGGGSGTRRKGRRRRRGYGLGKGHRKRGGVRGGSSHYLESRPLLLDAGGGGERSRGMSTASAPPGHGSRSGGNDGGGGRVDVFPFRHGDGLGQGGDSDEEDGSDDDDDEDEEWAVGGRLTDTKYVVNTVLERKALLRSLKESRRGNPKAGGGATAPHPPGAPVMNVLTGSPLLGGVHSSRAGDPSAEVPLLPPPTTFHPSGPEYTSLALSGFPTAGGGGPSADPLCPSKGKGKEGKDVTVIPLLPSSAAAPSSGVSHFAPPAPVREGGANASWEKTHGTGAMGEARYVKEYPLSSMAAGVNYVVESIFRVASIFHGDVVQICGDGVLVKFSVDDEEYSNVLGAKHTREDVTEARSPKFAGGERGADAISGGHSRGAAAGTMSSFYPTSSDPMGGHDGEEDGGATGGGGGHGRLHGKHGGGDGAMARAHSPSRAAAQHHRMNASYESTGTLMGGGNMQGGYGQEREELWTEVIVNGVSYRMSSAERAVRSAKTLQEMMMMYLDYSEDMFISPELLQCPMAIVDEDYSLKGRLRYHVSKHYAVLSRCIPLFFALERINIEYGAEIVMTQAVKNQVEGFVLSRPVHYLQVSDLNYHYIKETKTNHARNESSQRGDGSGNNSTSSTGVSDIQSLRGDGDSPSSPLIITERRALDSGRPGTPAERGNIASLTTTTTLSGGPSVGPLLFSPRRSGNSSGRDGQNPEDYPRFSAQGTIYALFNVCPLSDDDAFARAYSMEESQNRVRREHWRLIWDKYIAIVDLEPQINFLRRFVHSSISQRNLEEEEAELSGSTSDAGNALGGAPQGKHFKGGGPLGAGKHGNGSLFHQVSNSSGPGMDRTATYGSRFLSGRNAGGGGGVEDGMGKHTLPGMPDPPGDMAGSGTLGGGTGISTSFASRTELKGQSVASTIVSLRERVHDLMRELDTYNHIYEFSSRESYSCQKLWKYGHDMLIALGVSEEDFDSAYGQ